MTSLSHYISKLKTIVTCLPCQACISTVDSAELEITVIPTVPPQIKSSTYQSGLHSILSHVQNSRTDFLTKSNYVDSDTYQYASCFQLVRPPPTIPEVVTYFNLDEVRKDAQSLALQITPKGNVRTKRIRKEIVVTNSPLKKRRTKSVAVGSSIQPFTAGSSNQAFVAVPSSSTVTLMPTWSIGRRLQIHVISTGQTKTTYAIVVRNHPQLLFRQQIREPLLVLLTLRSEKIFHHMEIICWLLKLNLMKVQNNVPWRCTTMFLPISIFFARIFFLSV